MKNFQSAKNSGEAVLIELDDEKRSCLVQDISGEFACFKQIRDGGYVDGVFWIKMSLIQVLKRKTDQHIADRFLCENR